MAYSGEEGPGPHSLRRHEREPAQGERMRFSGRAWYFTIASMGQDRGPSRRTRDGTRSSKLAWTWSVEGAATWAWMVRSQVTRARTAGNGAMSRRHRIMRRQPETG